MTAADITMFGTPTDAPEPMPDGEAETAESATTPDPSGLDEGWWLTHPDGKQVRQQVLALWKAQDGPEKLRSAKERRNELWRKGVRGAQVVADEDEDSYSVRVPFGAATAVKAPNKADQLLRRVVATLTVDPPAPDNTPNSDDDRERDAAQLSARLVKVEGDTAKRNDVAMLRRALDLGGTYASVFVHTYWHPRKGGLEPLAIQAHPEAQTADDALLVLDPATGVQAPADPSTLTDRFVRTDRSLTDKKAEAQQTWRGDVVEELCLPASVRLLPITCDTDTDASGALVGRVWTLGDVIAVAYDGERPDEEIVKKLTAWRPDGWQQWVPKAMRAALDAKAPTRPDGTITEDAPVCVLFLYLVSQSEAPFGVRIMVSGPDEPCIRETRRVTLESDDDAHQILLPLPLAHFRWAEDTADGDYKGIAGIEQLAPMEEIRASSLRYQLEYMFNYAAPQVYIPMGSTMQEEQRPRRDGTPIRLNPGADNEPFFEPTPPMSPVPGDMYEGMGREMDTAAGLEETAQGVASGSVKSGVHAQQIIEQALVALSGIKQNADKFITRVWRNRLEWYRAYTDVPRLLTYTGESGDAQVKAFTGIDLIGAGDITIARGSGTMLPQSAKAIMAREELTLAAQLGDTTAVAKYQKALTGNTSSVLGLQDDPHRARIDRQLAMWRDAAAKQHDAAPPADPMAQPTVDPMTGAEVPPPPPPDPVADEATRLFAPNPTDELPDVAPLRFQELKDCLASRAFASADPRYQQALYVEYERMRAAAGVQTLAEQQQMQAQQAQMQQQMQMEQIESKNADQAAKTAFAESEGGPAAQRMTMQNAASQVGPQPEQMQ